MRNRRVLIRELPTGKLAPENFEMNEVDVPDPGEGEVLVRTILLSQDAANRAWMQGATYRAPVQGGEVMSSGAVAEVVASNSEGLAPGDLVWADTGWQEYAVLPGRQVQKQPDHRPVSELISLLGVAGKTAYHGLLNVAGIHAGETLLVSAAAGSVGSLVGQIGKLRGARVVGEDQGGRQAL